MTANDAFEAVGYMLKKLGIRIKEEAHPRHVFSSCCYNPKHVMKCFGFDVKLMPCIENAQYYGANPLRFEKCVANDLMHMLLQTKTISVVGFEFMIGNPFFMHLELENIATLDEFKVQADLVFPDDATKQVQKFIAKEILESHKKFLKPNEAAIENG